MARTFRRNGYTDQWTNGTGSDVAAEQLILVGNMIAVANEAIADGETGTISTAGVHEVAKDPTQAVNHGQHLYFDATNNRLTTTEGTNELVAIARGAATSSATTVLAWLNMQ